MTTNKLLESSLAAVQIEYSKVWVRNHPDIFAKKFLEDAEKYPNSEWNWKVTSREGFFTIWLERIKNPMPVDD